MGNQLDFVSPNNEAPLGVVYTRHRILLIVLLHAVHCDESGALLTCLQKLGLMELVFAVLDQLTDVLERLSLTLLFLVERTGVLRIYYVSRALLSCHG